MNDNRAAVARTVHPGNLIGLDKLSAHQERPLVRSMRDSQHRASYGPLVRSSDLGDAFMTSASWEEVEGFTWPYNRHFGQMPETSFSLQAQVVNDKAHYRK
jgi:hypothetical protein